MINPISLSALVQYITIHTGFDLLKNSDKLIQFLEKKLPEESDVLTELRDITICEGNTTFIDMLEDSEENQYPRFETQVSRMIEEQNIPEEYARRICNEFWIGIGGISFCPSLFPKRDMKYAEELLKTTKFGKEQGVRIIRKLAAEGFPKAQIALANYYELGHFGFKVDLQEAKSWLNKAAEQNESDAYYELATLYELEARNAIESDRKKFLKISYQHYSKAADLGDELSQFLLGNIYSVGRSWDKIGDLNFQSAGILPDYDKAFFYYNMSAAGCGNACLNEVPWLSFRLGLCFEYGVGTSINFEKAALCYRQIAGSPNEIDSGFPLAVCKLALCYESGTGVKEDPTEAILWHKKAIPLALKAAEKKKCEVFFHYYLGYCYDHGIVVDRDKEKARFYMKSASDHGVALATLWVTEDAKYQSKNSTKDKHSFFKRFKIR